MGVQVIEEEEEDVGVHKSNVNTVLCTMLSGSVGILLSANYTPTNTSRLNGEMQSAIEENEMHLVDDQTKCEHLPVLLELHQSVALI